MSLFASSTNFRIRLSSVHYSRHFQSQEGKKKTDDLKEDLDDLDPEDEAASKKPLVTTFELNETLYAEAKLEDTDVVYLWLGVRSPQFRPVRLDDTNCNFTVG